jgi:hypothetical protein
VSSSASRYRRVYANEWHDPAFRRLNDAARVVKLYVSAGPQTTSCGCFRLSSAVAVEDLGGTSEDFERHFEAACEAFGWAWDPLARVVWLAGWFDMNPPANPNVVASWAKLMKNVPDCDVKAQAIDSIHQSLKNLPASFREPWAELSKSFPRGEGLGNTSGNTRGETIQGSGIREQRTEKQRAGASGEKGAAMKSTIAVTTDIPDSIRQVARKATSFCGSHESMVEIERTFWMFWKTEHSDEQPDRSSVVAALEHARLERKRPS